MNIGIFAKLNGKGQIVIPKQMRDQLGFGADVTLNFTVLGNGIYIVPVEDFIPVRETESSYIKLLEKTKGTWETTEESLDEKEQKELELAASEQRQKPW